MAGTFQVNIPYTYIIFYYNVFVMIGIATDFIEYPSTIVIFAFSDDEDADVSFTLKKDKL